MHLQTSPEMGAPAPVRKQGNQSHSKRGQISEARRVCPQGCLLPKSSCPGLAWDGWAVGGCRQAHLETALSGGDGKTSYRTAPTPETPRATFSAARGSQASEDY